MTPVHTLQAAAGGPTHTRAVSLSCQVDIIYFFTLNCDKYLYSGTLALSRLGHATK